MPWWRLCNTCRPNGRKRENRPCQPHFAIKLASLYVRKMAGDHKGPPNQHQPKMPHRVTLSTFAPLRVKSAKVCGAGHRDASLRLSMTPAGSGRVSMLSCCRFILFTARNRAAPPSPAGDHEDHPYGSPGLVLATMKSHPATPHSVLYPALQRRWRTCYPFSQRR
jgi:hypothetical protein